MAKGTISVFVVNHNVAFYYIMLSTLFVAAVILMTLFANIYYNHQCLECMPVIGLYFFDMYACYWIPLCHM